MTHLIIEDSDFIKTFVLERKVKVYSEAERELNKKRTDLLL